jgi:hypothetical protein
MTTRMVITKEETFGLVAPLSCSKSEGGVSKMANDTPTLPSPALGGGKGGRINEGIISTEIAPFGE